MNVDQCQVCDNSPARQCYNTIVCSACRVFFYRCVLHGPPVACRKNNNCIILPEVAKIKKYKSTLHVHTIPQQTMVTMAKHYHPLLIARDHTLSALSIDSLLMWHKLSFNEDRKISDTLPVNMNISLAEAIENPTALISREMESYYLVFISFIACLKRLRPPDSHSEPKPNALKSYSRFHCRLIVSYIDFLVSTHYFNELSSQDKEHLAQENITNFIFFCVLKSRLKYGQVPVSDYCDQYKIMDHEKKVLTWCLVMMDKLFSTVIHPLYVELDFDEMELTAIEAIIMYSSAVELSDSGMKIVISARDAFTLKLMEYIENNRPELTRPQQLSRLSKLLAIINEVRTVHRFWRDLFTEAVVNDHGGLSGRITYDIYVNSKK